MHRDLLSAGARGRIQADAARIPGARFRTIPSMWGHMAGSGLNPADATFIEAEIKGLLAL
jgi:homoserine O-acetyltransferase/O-succinyltransferase